MLYCFMEKDHFLLFIIVCRVKMIVGFLNQGTKFVSSTVLYTSTRPMFSKQGKYFSLKHHT